MRRSLLLTPILFVLSALPTAAQAPSGQDAGAWQPLDGVAFQVGDEIATHSEIVKAAQLAARGRSIATQRDYQEQLTRTVRTMLRRSLEAQAGQDLGLDPAQIERIVNATMNDRRRDQGAAGFLAELEKQGIDPLSARAKQATELYQYLWQSSTVGRRGPFGTRPRQDRFVRPGELRAVYLDNLESLAPTEVQLQVLEIPVDRQAGVEAAVELIRSIEERIQAGEDFGQLVEEFGAGDPARRGVTPMLSVQGIEDPRIRSFALRAEPGNVSQPLGVAPPGVQEAQAFLLVKLLERRENQPPPFEDRNVQGLLRRNFQQKRESDLLEGARGTLRERAYLWMDPRIQAGPAGAGAQNRR